MDQSALQETRDLIRRHKRLDLVFAAIGLMCLGIAAITFAALVIDMAIDGAPRLSPDFFTNFPSRRPAQAGILSAWVGSTLVMIVNPILLGGYTLGCHSLRHLIGGRKDCVGTSAAAMPYKCVTCLNRNHMRWAWASLFWVGFTDFYIRALAMGWFTDLRLI